MTPQDFLKHMEDILEAEAGSISLDQPIAELEHWDSLTVMTFIAMADEEAGVTLSGIAIADAKTVKDLMLLLGDKG